MAKILWNKGYRYRKNDKTVFGSPDLTFKKEKIAIFVDGEFFHGKDWDAEKFRIKSNRDFWWNKIDGNIKRDLVVNKTLIHAGWTVLRFWNKDLIKNPESCLQIIENEIEKKQMFTYSERKKQLNIIIDKHLNDGFAAVTHYWQNYRNEISPYYKPDAYKYLQDHTTSVVRDSRQLYIPLRYDVPFPPPVNPCFKFIDLFAGIGGFRLAFQNLGGHCVFSSEWNYYAKKTYEANFGEVPFGDITQINENDIPNHDILIAGFPCQPFSIAGVSKKNALGRAHGFKDETQGTLFFDIVRILEVKRPKVFLLENVKNLKSHDHGKTFNVIKGALEELGYSFHYQILNGKHFVPQHRERIVMIGFNRDYFHGEEQFKYPEMPKANHAIKEILINNCDRKYTLSDKLWNYLQKYAAKHKKKGNGFGFGLADLNGISRTISARYYKDGAEILIPQEGMNPRRLTPRECALLQGYPNNFIIPVSDNQAYRQFGNSVVVPLMQAVGENIVQELIKEQNGKYTK